MRLAIADPPYPPQYGERFDLAGGGPQSADHHPEAALWDDLDAHRALIELLVDTYDGWAIATTPDGLGAYHPLPVSARIMAWHRRNGMPGGHRLVSSWEPVIVFVPESRRPRATGPRVRDVLDAASPRVDFPGAKPPEWTRWVLDALGYDPALDTVVDLFPGSGLVSAALS